MKLSPALLILLIFICSSGQGANSQRSFIEQFSSSRLQMLPEDSPSMNNPGRYPKPLNFLFEYVFNWSPTGVSKNLSPVCSNEVWGERLLDPRLKGSLHLQGALIQKYFQDCRSELETGRTSNWANLTKIMSMNYAPQKHPFLRKVLINLPGNVKLTGLLGLKGDLKRRPFVVIRTGIFSNVDDFRPERAWLMMLFEQSPFNVLLVENMTSPDFVANNSQLSLGGYDEGIQNILIARLLRDRREPLSQLVESVHMFGISLGGHGVLFSSLLNKYNSPAKEPLIQSFTALCPVVNLQSSLHNLTSQGFFSNVVDIWGRGRMAEVPDRLPEVRHHKSFGFMEKAVSEIARTYKGGLSYISSVRLPPGMSDGSEFWKLNDFWSFYSDVEQPVVIYATQNDPLVPFSLNAQMLQNKSLKVNSKNIHVIDLPEGVHCTLPVPYDWGTLTTLFANYIKSHSARFKTFSKYLDIDMGEGDWAPFLESGSAVRISAKRPEEDSSYVAMEILFKSPEKERKGLTVSLPLSDLDFRFYNPELSRSEQEMIVRWVNQNIKGRLIQDQGAVRLRLEWPVAQ